MNRRQKLVQRQFLNDEERVIKRLKSVYDQSMKDINGKIAVLDSSIAQLQKAYNDIGEDDIGDLARAVLGSKKSFTPEEAKETLQSMIQSKVYQKKYQQGLQKQVGGVLDKMHQQQFKTVSDYLEQCYENGFVGTMYDLHGQGIPMCFPIDQEQMVRAVQLDSKIVHGYYRRLGVDVAMLKKRITAEVSRGVATAMSYQQVAQQLAGKTTIGYTNAIRIARTEGHRIQCQAGIDACNKAKDMGADVVKQWDSTLDARTRDSHAKLDGEIREIDERFSNGLRFPGDPNGAAAEVINCRCALLQRAKWNLGENELKTLQERAEFFGLDKSDSFEAFKAKYLNAVDSIFSVENPIKDLDLMNMTLDEANEAIKKAMFNLQAQTEKMDYPYGLVFGHQASTVRVQVKKDSHSAFSYDSKDDVVYINPYNAVFRDYDFNEAMLHELAHRYDRTAVESWKSQGFKSSLTLANEYAIRNADSLEKLVLDYPEDYYLQDIINIVSDGKIKVFAGHGSLSEDAKAREVFANLSSLRSRNAESYNALKNNFPDLINEFESLFGGE